MIDHSKLHIFEDGNFKAFNFGMMFKIVLSFNFFRLSELQNYYFLIIFFGIQFF